MTEPTPLPLTPPVGAPTPRQVLIDVLTLLGAAPRSAVEAAVRNYRDTLLATLAADLRLVGTLAAAARANDPHAPCVETIYGDAADYLDQIRTGAQALEQSDCWQPSKADQA